MSTVVERPMSVIDSVQQPSSSHSRTNSIEIIDVDSFDHGAGQPQLPPGNLQRGTSRTDSIWIESDDDEVEILSSRVISGHNVDRAQSHRQYISPPPPRRSNQSIPPVPTINPRLATRPPSRTLLSSLSSLPVFPSAQPPNFEMGPVAGPSRIPSATNPPQAAPISRHVPTLGLGGALISSNNRSQNLRQQARAAATRRRNAISYADDIFSDYYMTPNIHMFLNELAFEDAADPLRGHHHFVKQPREKEQYQQHYTHASKPEPGFTFDFSPACSEDSDGMRPNPFPPTSAAEPIIIDDDDDEPTQIGLSTVGQAHSSGARTLNSVLVCAKCLDPLVLNASLSPEEGQFKRVWGLRCGHLIDEKCLNELGQPHEEPDSIPAAKDRKGKGKAKAAPLPIYAGTVPEHQFPIEEDTSNNIRSRLRSRPNTQTASSSSSSSTAAAAGSSSTSLVSASYAALSRIADQILPSPAKKRRGPAKKPKIEAEFEWKCPVPDCGRIHLSVKIDGIWGPETDRDFKNVKGIKDEARGAVAIFA